MTIPEAVNPTSLEFISLAWRRLPGLRPLMLLPLVVGLLSGVISGLAVNSNAGLMAAVLIFAAVAWGVWYFITSTNLRKVLLLERDGGESGWVWRFWWRSDEALFPDSWRFSFGRGRLLVLDAMEDEPIAFNPFLRPLSLPAKPDDFVSPVDFGQVSREARAVEEILKLPAGNTEALKTGLLVAALLGSLGIGYIALNAGLDRLQGS